MRKVAISQRIDCLHARDETRDALDQRLPEMILALGMLPFPVPNAFETQDQVFSWCNALDISAIVLSGGNDLGEYQNRDLTEASLLEWAAKRRRPVLGICRGMQMMITHAGGTLKAAPGHVRSRHHVKGELTLEVNSFHQFVVEELPDIYKILAKADDQTVEAIEHKDLPWQGWMWHPEREKNYLQSGAGSHLGRMCHVLIKN